MTAKRLLAIVLAGLLSASEASSQIRAQLGPPIPTSTPFETPIAHQLPIPPEPVSPSVPKKIASAPQPALAVPVAPLRPPERFWGNTELLLWWMKAANLPPLVTASPDGTTRSDAGVLDAPGSVVLFGGPVNRSLTAGTRLTLGYWFNDEQTCGIEGYYFQLGVAATHATGGSPGIVGRPFFNVGAGTQDAELVSFPGIVDGTVHASATTGSLLGAGVLARCRLYQDRGFRLDCLLGYRYLSLIDNVAVTENLTSTDPAQSVAPLGTNIIVADSFHAVNQFHGCDLGLAASFRRSRWSLDGTIRVALGATSEYVNISGATTITVPSFAPNTSAGGLLALSSNSGPHLQNRFAVVPEARIQLGYDLTPRTRIHCGYSFLYWSHVVRAGEQMDLAVNPALLPPSASTASPLRPAFGFQGTSFWAQGIDLGLSFRF